MNKKEQHSLLGDIADYNVHPAQMAQNSLHSVNTRDSSLHRAAQCICVYIPSLLLFHAAELLCRSAHVSLSLFDAAQQDTATKKCTSVWRGGRRRAASSKGSTVHVKQTCLFSAVTLSISRSRRGACN